MEQHPIPQQISSYEFRLVGDMTLKQFAKVAVGLLLTYIAYHSRFIFIFRLPLALTLFLLGVGSAFFPINERPLEFWLLTFFRVVYSPTIFIWKKSFLPKPISQVPSAEAADQVVFPQVQKTTIITPSVSTPTPQPTLSTGLSPQKLSKPEQSTTTQAQPPGVEIFKMIKEVTPKKPLTSTPPDFLRISLPATPTTPNIINGLVMDDKGKIIEGAIVEIQDQEGNPIRAMRTNLLGQFQTATPLPDGHYLLLIEKEPYQFDIIKIEASGKIIPPLQIRAKKIILN